jgi:predicted DNA-binding transcriptional regulator AlpA
MAMAVAGGCTETEAARKVDELMAGYDIDFQAVTEDMRAPARDPLLPAKAACRHVGLSYAAFYRAIAEGRMPKPCYPARKAPRWYQSELDTAVKATRLMPALAMVERRKAKLARHKTSNAGSAAA